jgi:Dyp-type peroxidase family
VVALELADIQGNILNGYGFPRAAHLFCSVGDGADGRGFLGRLLGDGLQSAEVWGASKPEAVVNVALTFSGLERLGVEDAVLRELPGAFREPTRRRAERLLGDTGENAPPHWDLDTSGSHILVLVAASDPDDDAALRAAVGRAKDRAAECGVEVGPYQPARSLENQREHFGWADGFGQPAVEGAPVAPSAKPRRRIGQGVPLPDGITWRDLKAGEFVHGYPDEDNQLLSGRAAPLLRNGTYLIYRKLEQDVARFNEFLDTEAARYREALGLRSEPEEHVREMLAAKIVGRWRDGVALPLAERRSAEDTRRIRHEASADPDNDFRYARLDADGRICPRGAHIRRANPRDALVGGGETSRRHRIIRRGMAYGDPYDPANAGDGRRGLLFMCFNADIERQFEFVQTQWCNDGNAFHLGADRDVFSGHDRGTGKMTIEGPRPFLLGLRQVVFTRGCEYLLMPGLNALEDIVRGRPGVAGHAV